MNRLADSLSPYLLQHKDNPVDWFPWGQEAFDLARQSDKPIFLSVGYAACHWCHVMERESFEDEATAALLNENFVSIKVDREERPDVDQVYMNAVQVMTGHGGWPMSVFLNHELKPFYAGTYWPKTQRFGMPGFSQILDALADAWKNRRQEVDQHAGDITRALDQIAVGSEETASQLPQSDRVVAATDRLIRVLDRSHGGFGEAPKFPHATDLILLLRRGTTTDDDTLIQAAEFTLDRMAAGGIRDHIGGGFARYSVDTKWLVPHFEKMLYDNALLGEAYVRAFQVTGNQRHADVAREIFDYLCRDMVDDGGGLHCSEDADSEGVEGKFYVWTPAEVLDVLGQGRGERFCEIYDISESGNFEGKSIPNLPRGVEDWASEASVDPPTLSAELAEDCERLRVAREQRIRPGRDDKVLTAWNSLAIKALAVGGAVLGEPSYIDAAARASEFLLATMRRPENGRLLHAYRDGKAHLDGYLDDYAYTAEAFLALFEATAQARWVGHAEKLADHMIELFEDRDHGGFFYTASDAESLITRNKDWHDGSLVSGNASAAMALLQLSRLTGREDYRQAVERTLIGGSAILEKQFAAAAGLLAVLDRFHHDHEQLVLAVPDEESMQALRTMFFKRYRPNATHSWVIGQAPETGPVASLNQQREVVDDQPTLYQCVNFSCQKPLVGAEVRSWLEQF